MSSETNYEKCQHYLQKIGGILTQQIELLFKKGRPELCKTLTNYSGIIYTENILSDMENGISVELKYWFYIWLYFQNLDKIIQAYDLKEMLFLESQSHLEHIEKDIMESYKKDNEKQR